MTVGSLAHRWLCLVISTWIPVDVQIYDKDSHYIKKGRYVCLSTISKFILFIFEVS